MTPWSIKYYDETGEVSAYWHAKSLADTSICCEIEPGKWAFLLCDIGDPLFIRAWYDGECGVSEYYPNPEEYWRPFQVYAYESFREFFKKNHYYFWDVDTISSISKEEAWTGSWHVAPDEWDDMSGMTCRHDRLMGILIAKRAPYPWSYDLGKKISEEIKGSGDPVDILYDILDIIEDVESSVFREKFADFLCFHGEELGTDPWAWDIVGEYYIRPDDYEEDED